MAEMDYSQALDHNARARKQSDEKESGKLEKAVVLYFPGKVLGSQVGAHCGDCWKFVGSETGKGRCIEVERAIAAVANITEVHRKVQGRVIKWREWWKRSVVAISGKNWTTRSNQCDTTK